MVYPERNRNAIDCSSDDIGLRLKNIFVFGELKKVSVTENISATAEKSSVVRQEGDRELNRSLFLSRTTRKKTRPFVRHYPKNFVSFGQMLII